MAKNVLITLKRYTRYARARKPCLNEPPFPIVISGFHHGFMGHQDCCFMFHKVYYHLRLGGIGELPRSTETAVLLQFTGA